MNNLKKLLTREQILTIPNAMSLFRLILVPFIGILYTRGDEYTAIALLALSALTDVFDGVVARKLNMVSDLGKVLDPIADKLTHFVLLLCLISNYKSIIWILVLLIVKEVLMLTFGGIVLRRTSNVHSAKWHGKMSTVVFELTMFFLMLFPDINPSLGEVMIDFCGVVMLFSLTMYLVFYIKILNSNKKSAGR